MWKVNANISLNCINVKINLRVHNKVYLCIFVLGFILWSTRLHKCTVKSNLKHYVICQFVNLN